MFCKSYRHSSRNNYILSSERVFLFTGKLALVFFFTGISKIAYFFSHFAEHFTVLANNDFNKHGVYLSLCSHRLSLILLHLAILPCQKVKCEERLEWYVVDSKKTELYFIKLNYLKILHLLDTGYSKCFELRVEYVKC